MSALAAHILECTPSRVASAKRHSSKSVAFVDLRKMRLLPETRIALTRAAQKSCPCCTDQDCGKRSSRLPASCHDVYAAIRTATVRGYAGAVVSGNEIAKLLAISARQVWDSIRRLRALGLLQRIKQFENRAYTNIRTGKVYGRIKSKSSYLLGTNAPPVKVRVPTEKTAQGGVLKKVQNQPSLRSGEGVRSARPLTQGVDAKASHDTGAFQALEGRPDRPTIAPIGAQSSGEGSFVRATLDDLRALTAGLFDEGTGKAEKTGVAN